MTGPEAVFSADLRGFFSPDQQKSALLRVYLCSWGFGYVNPEPSTSPPPVPALARRRGGCQVRVAQEYLQRRQIPTHPPRRPG